MRKKIIGQVAGTLVTLALLIGTAFTFSYFHSETSFANAFLTPGYSVSLQETFTPIDNWAPGLDKEKRVWVENNGETDAFVRIKYSEKWSNNLPLLTNNQDTVLKNWTAAWQNQWIQIGDWWYYKKVLKAGTKTDPILSSIILNPLVSNDSHAPDYGQAEYALTFKQEDVQANSDPEPGWGVTAITDSAGNVTWSP
jgi:hypothetical protein